MNVFEGLILGVIQGLTEFLPISSSGHLVLFQKFFGLTEGMLTFDIAVHFATLIAVISVFRKDIAEIIKRPFSKLSLLILVGTIPTVILGIVFKDLAEKLFESGVSLGFEFILTGLILWYGESVQNRNKGLDRTTYTDASIIGVAQGIAAVLPAVSRSGFTIAASLFRGMNREFAAKFSFLVSIPAVLGATALDGMKILKGTEQTLELLPLLVGVAAAFISGYAAIKFMLRIITKGSLKMFSYYVFALGALIIIDQLVFQKFFPRLF